MLGMGKAKQVFTTVALGLVGFFALGACGGSESDSASTAAADNSEAGGPVVIDVRTPEEFAAGHLEGAVNIDVQAADFDARIGELDPAAAYIVYCRSGNRSGVAVERMSELGIANAVNAGSLDSAAEYTGVAVVT